MSYRNVLCVGFALVAVVVVLSGSASADLITVGNASFESPTLANGTAAASSANSWTDPSSGCTWEINNLYGYDAPDSNAVGFYDASGDGTPRGGDGINVLSGYMSKTRNGDYASQTLTDTLHKGKYTLTVGAGANPGLAAADLSVTLGTTGDAQLATLSAFGSSLPVAEFSDRQLVLNVAEDNTHIGEAIVIRLGATRATAGDNEWIAYDNVRLDYIPEPGTLALSVFAAMGLMAYAWRKRK